MVEEILGCKWTLPILTAIDSGHHRPGSLRRAVGGISVKVLNERLTKLTRYGILERRVLSAMPPHVEYHLTVKGRDLAGLVWQIREFCTRWDRHVPAPAATGKRGDT